MALRRLEEQAPAGMKSRHRFRHWSDLPSVGAHQHPEIAISLHGTAVDLLPSVPANWDTSF